MLIAPEIVSIPISLLTHYHHFISDKEFLVILHLQGITTSGKASFETIAERLEYKSIKGVNNAVKNMVERGVVKYGKNKYEVDVHSLYASCYDMQEKVEVELAKPKEKKAKEVKPEHAIAGGVLKEFKELSFTHVSNQVKLFLNNNLTEQQVLQVFLWSYRYENRVSATVFALRNTLKHFIGANIAEDDFIAYLAYVYTYQNRNNPDIEAMPYLNLVTVKNYNRWVDEGRVPEYSKKPKIDYSDI